MKKFKSLFAVLFAVLFLPWFSACFIGSKDKSFYDVQAELVGDTLNGVETVTFYNDSDNAFSVLKFNLYANAFRKDAVYSPISAQYYYRAYEKGESYGNIDILSVKSGENQLTFSVGGVDQNVLTVELKDEVFPNETAEVSIEFSVKLANVVARTGINDKTINLANFYPILCGITDGNFVECPYYSLGDPFFSDVADYRVQFTCDAKYTVAAGGKEVFSETVGDKTVRKFTAENSRSFAIVLSENFETKTAQVDGITVKYFYFNDSDSDETLNDAVSALKYFSDTFGEYPYDVFSVVQTEFVQGGMEFSSLVFVSSDLERKAYREVVVHETAHQWWQAAVGNNEITHAFIDEGLAEYSVVLFYENHPEYGFTRENLIKSSEQTYKVFCSVYQKILGEVNTVMLRSLDQFKSEYEYVNIAYVKSCIMFDYLRQTIGDDNFFSGLRRFYAENKFSCVTEAELIGAFERTGADSNGFFNSFLNGSVIL